jgi:hypothetical protein
MKQDICAVCGATNDLVEHHIDPVVYSGIGRNRKKKLTYDRIKPLGECSVQEIFAYLMEIGVVSDSETITVCQWHHNIIHGIVRYHKYSHSEMIKTALKKAVESGKKLGRPTNVTTDIKAEVLILRENGVALHSIAKKLHIGVGTTSKIIKEHDVPV